MIIIRTTDTNILDCDNIELPKDEFEAKMLVKSIVDGYYELVELYIHTYHCYMFVDDNGKLKGKPFNKVATEWYDHPDDYIVGDVVVMDEDELLDFNNMF